MAVRLLFVYKAKSQAGHRVLDWAHKIVSPKTYRCTLCNLTYGNFRMHQEWKLFLENLEARPEFLYENEWQQSKLYFPTELPVVLLLNEPGNKPEVLLNFRELKNLGSLNDLMDQLKSRIPTNAFKKNKPT